MAGEKPSSSAPESSASDWYKPAYESGWDSLTEAGKAEKGDKPSTPEEGDKKAEKVEKEPSFNERELDRIAKLTGRVPDDPEVLKLNLVLRYQKFEQYRELYDGQKEKHIMIQQQTYEDIATAKRELEEAMYLYDETFKKQDDKIAGLTEEQRRHDIKDKLREDEHFGEGEATTGNSWVKARLERNKVYDGKRGEVEESRQSAADRLYDSLGKMSEDIKEDEIFKTYELRKEEAPEAAISGRRDGYNAGKNGLFIVDKDGHMAPERPVDWALYPHAPKSAEAPASEADDSKDGKGGKGEKGSDDGEDGSGDGKGGKGEKGPGEKSPEDILDEERAKELEREKAKELESKEDYVEAEVVS